MRRRRLATTAALLAAALGIAACSDEAVGPSKVSARVVTAPELALARVAVADATDRVLPALADGAERTVIAAALGELMVQLERVDAPAAMRAVERTERILAGDVASPEFAAIDLALAAVRSRLGPASGAPFEAHH